MSEKEKSEDLDRQDRDEIYSKVVRAGKRTYFFDVKSTRKDDFYLTITESKKVFDREGQPHYEKHKIFLYKEDFDKFAEGYQDAIDFIIKIRGQVGFDEKPAEAVEKAFSSVEFEDLDNEGK
ncbi:MAG: DNA-binding protein [Bacteroidetes bacterium GWF2_49_14]|nr:MAG: DNA-binding protein [Bacteroidetes bacterium GWF2_49_14]HBB93608.1 DNA-binding protein [Bacteroidales bacterium]